MSGLNKSAVKIVEHNSVDPKDVVHSSTNPVDHVDETLDDKQKHNSSGRTSLGAFSSVTSFATLRNDSCYLVGSQPVQEGHNYDSYMIEMNMESVNRCLKIAEEKRHDATKTLVTLQHQGEQISQTHIVATDIDQNLGVICDMINKSNTNTIPN
ncbi:SNAP25 homologous protein SNAP33-like [Juglans microcarpa x Juglans regia]|uniref:SNAP25 homologous protein SNAP33-like n=1 Tax=Juglans microcarpa x Juglans regia TaxID=2249226 RepID=UPI001B7F0CE6|nr:SNAP25 homologous protein SNAP33-like [Juglans microcarpa x Juglans regia]